jgi:fatty-acyl-CoA synthase
MPNPTPTIDPGLKRRFSDFSTLTEALDYAAKGVKGINFYSRRGEIERTLPYRDLRDQAQDMALKLVQLGLPRGARVALIAETSADFITLFMACQYASLLPVPLPLPTSFGGRDGYVQQLERQMMSCTASAVIAPSDMLDLVNQAAHGLGLNFVGTADDVRALSGGKGDLRLPQSGDICYLQYSSGSTRFPHGVAVTHRSLLANCHGMGRYGVQLRDDDRCVSWLPMYHDMGLVGCFLTPLTCQVSTDYLSTEHFARRPMQWINLMAENRGTISYSPSFGYELCARRASPETLANIDLSAWRVAGIGADMIRPDVMREFVRVFSAAGFKETGLVASYGLAECTLAVSFAPVDTGVVTDLVDERVLANENRAEPPRTNGHAARGVAREVVDCGIPLPGYEVEIRNEEGLVLGDRQVGRIFVRGASVMLGYFNDPEATEQVMQDGWLDTGDMGYRAGQSLFVVGRIKDLIIINGRNHWPQDMEWAVEQLPALRSGDSAAISVPGLRDEEVAVLLVQCRLRELDEREALRRLIKNAIQESLGIHAEVVFVAPRSLPKTSSGKLSRSKARIAFMAGEFSGYDEHEVAFAKMSAA